MNTNELSIPEQLARLASRFQEQTTGHAPGAVAVVLSQDTLVVTMHDALTTAEKVLARSPKGAAQVQELHRQLFADSMQAMRDEIKRITGRDVREAVAEIEPATGVVVHAFTTGAIVQVYLLSPDSTATNKSDGENEKQAARADDDGMHAKAPRGFVYLV